MPEKSSKKISKEKSKEINKKVNQTSKKINNILVGTIRIKTKDCFPYAKTSSGWKKIGKTSSIESIESLENIIKLFKTHNNFKILIDRKNPDFLKGQLSPDGKCQGARINVLPDGEQIDKAFSLFAKNLTVHDESSHDHWDVLYQNPGGKFAYVYTLKKKKKHMNSKYKKVDEFGKIFPRLERTVLSALKRKDMMALPMYTLLKTYMRVGNRIYFKANGHMGLTTLEKRNIQIKGRNVIYDYISKGGVPVTISVDFPEVYVLKLKNKLKNLKGTDFVFTDESGHPLSDVDFEGAFKAYCGKEFYPHIVRSFYATSTAREFLKENKHPKKEEVRELFNDIAERLGHKRFVKKDKVWKDSYNVTIHNYIQPDIVEKIKNSAHMK